MSKPSVEALTEFYRAFVGRDRTALERMIAEGAVLYADGKGLIAGAHSGRDKILDLFGELDRASGGTLRPWKEDSNDIMASEYHGVILDRWVASRDTQTLDTHIVIVANFEADQIANLFIYFTDQYTFDEFFGR